MISRQTRSLKVKAQLKSSGQPEQSLVEERPSVLMLATAWPSLENVCQVRTARQKGHRTQTSMYMKYAELDEFIETESSTVVAGAWRAGEYLY